MILEAAVLKGVVSGASAVIGAVTAVYGKKKEMELHKASMALELSLARIHAKDDALQRIQERGMAKEQGELAISLRNQEWAGRAATQAAEAFNIAVATNDTSNGAASYVRPFIVVWGATVITMELIAEMGGIRMPDTTNFAHLLDLVEMSFLSIVGIYGGARIIK